MSTGVEYLKVNLCPSAWIDRESMKKNNSLLVSKPDSDFQVRVLFRFFKIVSAADNDERSRNMENSRVPLFQKVKEGIHIKFSRLQISMFAIYCLNCAR